MKHTTEQKEAHKLYKESWDKAENENYNSALNLIERAITLDPNRSIYWATKARFLMDSKKPEQAIEAAKKAIELGPKNFHAWIILGLIENDRQDFEKSAYYFEEASKIKPDYNIFTLLASVQYEFDLEQAIINANKALDQNPDWEEAKDVLDKAVVKLKKLGQPGRP